MKNMLINNSLPIVDGKIRKDAGKQEEIYSRRLIVDKRILLNLMTDLQRFRKLLNIKKKNFIFHAPYYGKPKEFAAWHTKVESIVTSTFKQLNIRRLIDIIGYDPALYLNKRMSYGNIDNIKRVGQGELLSRGGTFLE